MKCPRCGKDNPADIHTCSPQLAFQPQPWSEVACPHCNGSGLAEDAPQPQREWVGLTDEDLREIESRMLDMGTVFDLMRLIEAKLRERNGGAA